jgi:hypothetical protein
LTVSETNEEARLDAYRDALLKTGVAGYLREIISDQLDELLHLHDQATRLRGRTAQFQN